MQIIFLGTSAGKPTKERNVSAIALKKKNFKEWILFDAGEATQHQIMKVKNLSLAKLRYVFITHLHGDHLYGIFGLLASRSMCENISKLTIFGPKNIKNILNCIFRYSQLNLSFELEIIEVEPEKEFEIFDFIVKPIHLSHSIETFAFILKEKDKPGRLMVEKLIENNIMPGEIYSKIKNREIVKIGDKIVDPKKFLEPDIRGRVVIVAGDNDNPDILTFYKKEYKEIDLLIHEATYTEEVYKNLEIKIKHSTAKEVAKAAKKMRVKNLILTHFSSRFTESERGMHKIDEIYEEAKKFYDKNLFLAKDFDIFELDLKSKNLILKNINQ